jgi:hypothetical protein
MSQTQAIVRFCNMKGSITNHQAMQIGILSLHRRLTDLREKGYEFSSQWVKVPTRYGKGETEVLKYRIIKQPRSK